MFYRMMQLYHALFPSIKKNEYLWIEDVLTQKELILFKAQSLIEQRHALDVAYDIQKDKQSITKELGPFTYACLIKAALLHDCGKSIFHLRIWQRVFIVLVSYAPLSAKGLLNSKHILGKTLKIYHRHPVWGKRLALQAGVCIEVQELIKNHHLPLTAAEKILFTADNRH